MINLNSKPLNLTEHTEHTEVLKHYGIFASYEITEHTEVLKHYGITEHTEVLKHFHGLLSFFANSLQNLTEPYRKKKAFSNEGFACFFKELQKTLQNIQIISIITYILYIIYAEQPTRKVKPHWTQTLSKSLRKVRMFCKELQKSRENKGLQLTEHQILSVR